MFNVCIDGGSIQLGWRYTAVVSSAGRQNQVMAHVRMATGDEDEEETKVIMKCDSLQCCTLTYISAKRSVLIVRFFRVGIPITPK